MGKIHIICGKSVGKTVFKKLFFSLTFLLISFAVVASAVTVSALKDKQQSSGINTGKTIIVDAGHGGFDGGAVVGNVFEKDINLKIAIKLNEMLTLNGYNVIMTRNDDSSTEDNQNSTISARKRSDLNNRLKLIKNNGDAIFISIHLNKFELSSAKGCQVFYGTKNKLSKLLAECVQKQVVKNIQPQNKRVVKPATSSTFLLYYSPIPAIIAECGFMSNSEELKLLCNEEYQNKLAFSIMCGINEYFNIT